MAKDEEYESAVKKGSQLLDMVLSGNSTSTQEPSPKAPQTKFTAVSDLSKYGYTNDLTSSKSGRSVVRHLASAFHALNINAEMVVDGGNNTMVEHEHLESRTIDGVFYPAALGIFAQVCNPVDGVLVAYNNYSTPYSGLLQEPPVLTVPPLRHWSDIAYLQWLGASSNPEVTQSSHPGAKSTLSPPSVSDLVPALDIRPAPIKYIFRLTIQNTATCSILNKIMTKHNYPTYNLWPGKTFSVTSEEGKAIVGTPNGAGVAWLLAQHKKELGERRIEKVTVFYAENENDLSRWPSLCFWIV